MFDFKNTDNKSSTWTLPEDAYPDRPDGTPMPPEKRAVVDQRLRDVAHLIPVEPGNYVDGDGDYWRLDEDGGWTDHKNEKRDARYTPIIGLMIEAKGSFIRID